MKAAAKTGTKARILAAEATLVAQRKSAAVEPKVLTKVSMAAPQTPQTNVVSSARKESICCIAGESPATSTAEACYETVAADHGTSCGHSEIQK